MVNQITLKNFKIWQGISDLNLAPVTLLLGTNSSGKSSLLQPLLLLKQTAISPDRSVHLNLGGDENDYVDAGGFLTLLHNAAREQRIAIRLEFRGKLQEQPMVFDVEYMRDSSYSPTVSQLILSDGEARFKAIRRGKGAYSIYKPGVHQPLGRSRSYAPERSIAFSAEAIAALGEQGNKVQDISLKIRQHLEQIAYLGPLRTKPARDYAWNKVRPGVLGDDGRNTAYILAASYESRNSNNESNLIQQVSKWLKRMNLADRLEVRPEGRSGRYRINLITGNQHINLKDVGIGVSQVLPVLVMAYFAPQGATIILEEPEIHLHPLAQAELAEMLVTVSKERNVQFLVETHSEHLFRRLQTIISRDDLEPDECSLYFVHNENNQASLSQLHADDYGRIQNWPDKFFGMAMEETRQQMANAIAKRKKAK